MIHSEYQQCLSSPSYTKNILIGSRITASRLKDRTIQRHVRLRVVPHLMHVNHGVSHAGHHDKMTGIPIATPCLLPVQQCDDKLISKSFFDILRAQDTLSTQITSAL